MALDENQLAVVLQASIDRASELLRHDGGFLPFGARAKPSGEIEFVQLAPENEGETLGELIGRLGDLLAGEARRSEILGSALVANARRSTEEQDEVIAVLVETPGFSRSITVPYRIERDEIALGQMILEPADPTVFARVAEAR